MQFDWDDTKRRQNLAKHGVDFEDIKDFDWATALEIFDDRKDYNELRIRSMGHIQNRLHVCVYTERSDCYRIISLRKANKREERIYEKIKNHKN
jgi:uncharacterized DUF497 family protein